MVRRLPSGLEGRQVSGERGLGFGGFLVGLGAGWVFFRELDMTSNVFAWTLILAGSAVVASSLLSRLDRRWRMGGLVGGVVGGLVIALFATSGPVLIGVSGVGYSGGYRAEDAREFSGALTSGRVLLDVESFNGPITVSTWDKSEYSISVLVRAKGNTDAEAEANLEKLVLDFDESLMDGRAKLVLRYNVPPTWTSRYSLNVEAYLPAEATIDLDLDSSNGGISIKGIDGGTIKLQTSNGMIEFYDVTGSRIDAVTSNGRVEGRLEAPDTSVSTSNGGVELRLPCTVTGRYVLRTSNAQVHLRVSPSSGVGYDLDLSTSNGGIDIDLPNLEYGLNQRTSKEARTRGFEDKAVQITVVASTSNASMGVEA